MANLELGLDLGEQRLEVQLLRDARGLLRHDEAAQQALRVLGVLFSCERQDRK